MSSTASPSPPCCGWDLRHWALGTSGGNILYWLLATGLAGWAWYKIGEKEEVIAAEMGEVGISLFDAPKLVAITVTAFFAILAVLCITFVVLLASNNPTTQQKRLEWFWVGTLAWTVAVLAWCAAGIILSMGSERRKEIEEACKSIDPHCYPGYLGILTGSVIVEVVGFLNLAWMLTCIFKYRKHLEKEGTDGVDEEAAKPLNKGDTAAANSLGRHRLSRHASSSSRKKSSRRSDYASASYSMSKSRRSSYASGGYDEPSRGRPRLSSRRRSSSMHSLRDMERAVEREWAERSLSHSRRREEKSRSRSRARSASRSRRESFSSGSSDEGGRRSGREGSYRSMGKRESSRGRSASRNRRAYNSDSSDDSGRGRSKSRSRSRSRR